MKNIPSRAGCTSRCCGRRRFLVLPMCYRWFIYIYIYIHGAWGVHILTQIGGYLWVLTIFHDFHRFFKTIFNNFERRQYPGSTPAIPRSFGKLRGRVWGPRGEKFPYIYYGSARHLYGLLSISTPQGNKFPYIYYGSGRADLTTGEASFSR